jgi:hypothetical protein
VKALVDAAEQKSDQRRDHGRDGVLRERLGDWRLKIERLDAACRRQSLISNLHSPISQLQTGYRTMSALVEMQQISKVYPNGVVANKGVDFAVERAKSTRWWAKTARARARS